MCPLEHIDCDWSLNVGDIGLYCILRSLPMLSLDSGDFVEAIFMVFFQCFAQGVLISDAHMKVSIHCI